MVNTERIHADKPRQSGAQLLFAVAFIAGAALIVLFRASPEALVPGVTASSSAAVAAVLVLIMYAILGATVFSSSLEPDILGDNCYYLGFLFTLVSLALTLQAIDAKSAEAAEISVVIAGFGVALVSTITGIFLRVLLLQLRPTLAASETEARRQLIDAVRDFRSELSASVLEMKDFSRQVSQSLAEHHQNLEAAAVENGVRASEAVDAAITRARASAEAALVRETEAGAAALAETLQRQANTLQIATMDVEDKIEGFRSVTSKLGSRLQDTAASIEETGSTTSKVIGDLATALTSVGETIDKINSHVAVLEAELNRRRRSRGWFFWRRERDARRAESGA